MKQFIGTWSMIVPKDTSRLIVEINPFGSAMEGTIRITSKGRIVNEGRWLWGYNPEYDKFIAAEISYNSPNVNLFTYSFTSEHIAEKIEMNDVPNADPTSLISRFEFRTPDLIIQTVTRDDKILSTFTITRVKEEEKDRQKK
jgi:hypothetical protein